MTDGLDELRQEMRESLINDFENITLPDLLKIAEVEFRAEFKRTLGAKVEQEMKEVLEMEKEYEDEFDITD